MERESRSKIITIMMADIVDYTKWSSTLGREKFDEINEDFDRIALPLFERYAGHIVKKMGDAFIVSFESATDSLHCAIELQNKFWEYNASRAGLPIRIKVAINTGEVIIRHGDVYGETVNVASRIEKLTHPGQICFSESVFLAMNKNEIPHLYLGKKMVKGIKHPIKLFRVKGLHEEKGKVKAGWLVGAALDLFMILFWLAIMIAIGWLVFKLLVISGFWAMLVNNLTELWNNLF